MIPHSILPYCFTTDSLREFFPDLLRFLIWKTTCHSSIWPLTDSTPDELETNFSKFNWFFYLLVPKWFQTAHKDAFKMAAQAQRVMAETGVGSLRILESQNIHEYVHLAYGAPWQWHIGYLESLYLEVGPDGALEGQDPCPQLHNTLPIATHGI